MLDRRTLQRLSRESCPILELLNLEILESEAGLLRASIPRIPLAGNHVGILNAGALFALGEFIGGLVVASNLNEPERFQPVVRDVKIDFKAPATTDVIAEAFFSEDQASAMNAALMDSGRFDFSLNTIIKDANQTTVAITDGSYALRNFLKT
jgi:acyl-coenzyme A thioesterase PaaI-like protein